MKSGQITIKDIARELGVSPSTVSRALKDHPDISPDTKKAVTELAEKLHYQPNSIALSLRQSKTNTIGVIIPEIVHFFFSTVISGIEDVAYDAGYNVIVSQSNESYERELSDIKALVNSRVDGLMVSMSKETTNFDHFNNIIARGIPLVFFDRICEDISVSHIVVDDAEGAREATQHLIDQGCKRIVHLSGPTNLMISKKRREGYEEALKQNGIKVDESLIHQCWQGNEIESREITLKIFKGSNRPDGIFASNDLAAMGAMLALRELNLKIPDDVAVVGFSNWNFSRLTEPSLTSVDQPGFEMGQEAARQLIRQIESGRDEPLAPQSKVLKTKLIVRNSSLRVPLKA